jgi:hypothetical protein
MIRGQLVRVEGLRYPATYVGEYDSRAFGRCVVVRIEGRERFFRAGQAGPLCSECTTAMDRGRRRLREACSVCLELRGQANTPATETVKERPAVWKPATA